MDSEDRIKKMRTIAKERFNGHPHSSVWFLDRALEWFNRDDGCLSLQCSEKRLWIATFDHVYDNGEQHKVAARDKGMILRDVHRDLLNR